MFCTECLVSKEGEKIYIEAGKSGKPTCAIQGGGRYVGGASGVDQQERETWREHEY